VHCSLRSVESLRREGSASMPDSFCIVKYFSS
jgi:hypothetical protein